jgi:hypothetical protein
MTTHEFERKVTDLIKRYRLGRRMEERIAPLFSLVENLSQEDVRRVYNLLEKALITQNEDGKLLDTLNSLFLDFKSTGEGGAEYPAENPRDIQKKEDNVAASDATSIFSSGDLPIVRKGKQPKHSSVMKFNKHSFPSEKPNFGLKLNKLFAAFITEYGPEFITLVISDSILYTNNLILRIDLQTKEVLIGSSKSIKLYETDEGHSFLITEKPEVIPYGSTNGFYFKNITYEDILNLTNGDFFKVFSADILKTFKGNEIALPEDLEKVGYYRFE